MGGAGSLSAWYATSLFLACAGLMMLVKQTATSPAQVRAFAGVTLVTLLLALDQAIVLHERLLAMWLTLAADVSGWLPAIASILLLGWLLWRARFWAEAARSYTRLAWVLIFAGYAWGVVAALYFPLNRVHEVVGPFLKMVGAISLMVAMLRHIAATAPSITLRFTSGKPILLWLTGFSVLFSLLTVAFYLLESRANMEMIDPYRLFYLLDSGQEATIPTFFSVFLWRLSAALLMLISIGHGVASRIDARRWALLSTIFIYLSLDEAASLHEQLIGISRAVASKLDLDSSGLFYHAWVIPVGIAVLLLFLLYIPFLRRLPRTTALWMLFSGALFIMGALGFEMIGGVVVTFDKDNDTLRLGVETLEELLEMLALAAFAYTLVEYLAHHVAPVEVRLHPPVATANEPPA